MEFPLKEPKNGIPFKGALEPHLAAPGGASSGTATEPSGRGGVQRDSGRDPCRYLGGIY